MANLSLRGNTSWSQGTTCAGRAGLGRVGDDGGQQEDLELSGLLQDTAEDLSEGAVSSVLHSKHYSRVLWYKYIYVCLHTCVDIKIPFSMFTSVQFLFPNNKLKQGKCEERFSLAKTRRCFCQQWQKENRKKQPRMFGCVLEGLLLLQNINLYRWAVNL